MVYYGVLSKGCQRCRQRKVKCDRGKPECLKCKNSYTLCPGYRDLAEIMFRDESERIIQKACQIEQTATSVLRGRVIVSPRSPKRNAPGTEVNLTKAPIHAPSISHPLSLPIDILGANFFFAKYTFNGPPFSSNFHDWLTQSYLENRPSHVLRAVIEAVGMAAISNVSHAPHVASKSKKQYCKALTAMRQALNEPIQALADTTFMAAILLGLFETVNFEHGDRYHYWAAHVEGATALLELRGSEQFNRERGGQLYLQIRSQILLACIQKHIAVPPTLVQATYNFQTSAIRQQWQHRHVASPGSICEISFRIVNLKAACENDEITDPQVIRLMALEIDGDLKDWKAGVPPHWQYATIDAPEADVGTYFGAKRHVYPNVWVAEAWNNWRTLRLSVNQILLANGPRLSLPDTAQNSAAISIIRQCSAELCIATASFTDSPSVLSLIRPLYIVAMEELNARGARAFAVEQLRRISATMGIRQAGLLAETVSRSVDGAPGDFEVVHSRLMIPLVPCG